MKKIIILVVLLGLGAGAYIFGMPYYELHFSTLDLESDEVEYYIPTGSNLSDISVIMEEHKIIDPNEFLDFAEKLGFDETNIEPGKYKVTDGMKIKNLIYGLKDGNQEINNIQITFNQCVYLEDVAGAVAVYIEADSTEIITYLQDPKTKEKYGFNDETMPALFLPDTYEVGEWDMSAEGFTQFMADKYKEFWNDERQGKADDLNLTQSEVTTLASIIEAEQGRNISEWETIAGLYLNRVRRGMKLESDPTFKFCWGDQLEGVQRLLDKHRQIDCPYNTYLYPGIPPGPIRIPSKKAIDAILNAEDHNYIFMCAKPDNSGFHNFAETLSQHMENARAFWKYMDERDG